MTRCLGLVGYLPTDESSRNDERTPAMPTYEELVGAERIDTRDLIEVADELLAEQEDRALETDELEFLSAVNDLRSEVGEFEDGNALIREDTFVDYAQELAEDIGAIPDSAGQWPLYCIDWERAARELSQDYGLVSFMGHDYYARS